MAKKQQLTETQKELLSQYKKVAGRVNKRLERLEKLAENPEYENVLQYAYRLAERDIKEIGVGDLSSVRYRVPRDKNGNINTNKLESALRRVQKFDTAYKTTTKGDIDKTYRKDAATFNKAFGTNFTWSELKTFMDASDWNAIKKERGSANIQKVIKSMSKSKLTAEELNKMLTEDEKKKLVDEVTDSTENHKKIASMDGVTLDWYKRLEKDGLRFDLLKFGTSDEDVDESENPFID